MIVFKEPQAQETFPATEMNFDGYTNTLIGETYCTQIPYGKDFVPSNTITFPAVPLVKVETGYDLDVLVMNKEGEPYILEKLRKENDYSQFEPYTDNGKMVWESSLRRDYQNNKNISDTINLYGQDYINVSTTNGA